MSVLTCMGKINGIFVNHDGIKKQVLSGWVNQNGVAVPFYKKGGGSGDFQVIWNASPWGMAAGVPVACCSFLIQRILKNSLSVVR